MPIIGAYQTNHMKTNLKDYGNGILASDDRLAEIALRCLQQEQAQRQARIAAGSDWGVWNISDRH